MLIVRMLGSLLMFNIEPYLPEIAKVCKQYEAKSLTLFGSALSDEFDKENSDLDFLLELHGVKRGLNRYFAIKRELEEMLERDVDLVMPSAITNPFLKKSIYSQLKKCYET